MIKETEGWIFTIYFFSGERIFSTSNTTKKAAFQAPYKANIMDKHALLSK